MEVLSYQITSRPALVQRGHSRPLPARQSRSRTELLPTFIEKIMSLPKCFDLLNIKFFDNISVHVEARETIEELQALVDTVFTDISMLESTLTSQIPLLEPLNALLTIPAVNPAAMVAWITTFINDFLNPILKPYVTAV